MKSKIDLLFSIIVILGGLTLLISCFGIGFPTSIPLITISLFFITMGIFMINDFRLRTFFPSIDIHLEIKTGKHGEDRK